MSQHVPRRIELALAEPLIGRGYTQAALQISTFQMLAARVAQWRADFTDATADAHLIWATMHGLVTIELMHTRWGGPLVPHLQGNREQNYATAIGSLLEALLGR